jgi:hypothetical protein
MDEPARKSRFRLFRRDRRPAGLETCPVCARDFVNPVAWEPAGERDWWMLLRCGECDAWQEVTVSDAEAQRFDVELDRRADMLQRALARLDMQRMATDVETMIAALRRGLIDAADFAN